MIQHPNRQDTQHPNDTSTGVAAGGYLVLRTQRKP
jgi:hypothetical protein